MSVNIYESSEMQRTEDFKNIQKIIKEDKSKYIRTCAKMSPELKTRVMYHIAKLSESGIVENFSAVVRKSLIEYLDKFQY